jgi:hypothetical protein
VNGTAVPLHSMQTGGAEVMTAGWSVIRLRLGIFTSAERTLGTLRRGGWVGPGAGFKVLEEVSLSLLDTEHRTSIL